MGEPDELGGFARAEVLAGQELVDAGLQRAQVVVEQAGFEVGEQTFQGDEGEQLVDAVVKVTAAFEVIFQGRAEFVAQFGDQAGEGGTGETMLADKCGARDAGAPSVKQSVQAADFVEFAQVGRFAC